MSPPSTALAIPIILVVISHEKQGHTFYHAKIFDITHSNNSHATLEGFPLLAT